MTKIVIYGGTGSGKYALALQLLQDNPMLGEPVLIGSPSQMRPFLNSAHSGIGIVNATNIQRIITKTRSMAVGQVLFVPAPAEVEAWSEDLVSDTAAWDWLLGIDVSGNTNAIESGDPVDLSVGPS